MLLKKFTTPQPLTSNLTTIFKKKMSPLTLLSVTPKKKKHCNFLYIIHIIQYIPRVAKTTNDNVRRFYFMIFCLVIVGTQKYKTERKTATKQQIYTQKNIMRLSVHKIILCYYDGKKSEKKAPRKKLIPPTTKKKEIKTFIEYPP